MCGSHNSVVEGSSFSLANDHPLHPQSDIEDQDARTKDGKPRKKVVSPSMMTPQMAFREYGYSILELTKAFLSLNKLTTMHLKSLHVRQVPHYMVDNEFVIIWYRIGHTFYQSGKSLLN